MRRLRRWYIPACRGQPGPAGRASPQAGAGLRAGARRGRRRPAARISAAVYVSPELYSLPVSQEFASLRPPLGGGTRLVLVNIAPVHVDRDILIPVVRLTAEYLCCIETIVNRHRIDCRLCFSYPAQTNFAWPYHSRYTNFSGCITPWFCQDL